MKAKYEVLAFLSRLEGDAKAEDAKSERDAKGGAAKRGAAKGGAAKGGADAPFQFRLERGMRYMDLPFFLMVDWDVADGECNEHFTVKSLEEIDEIMKNWVGKNPSQFWVGYRTPSGGAHAFLLSEKMEIHHGVEIMQQLNSDRLYQNFCAKRGAFAVRVSPKRGRKGDYIASYWKTWGNGQALPELEEILRKHDSFLKPNRRYYK